MLYRTERFDVIILIQGSIAVLVLSYRPYDINMLGRGQVIVRLELLVVRRGSEAESSGGSSELK
eukprot:5755117-Pyramimonas_sp.AAC.1